MTYTSLAVLGVVVAVLVDLVGTRIALVRRKVFWTAYAIIVTFQFVTNGLLTGFGIVRYDGDAIVGEPVPHDVTPPMFGAGRVFYAPVEDVLFGFALVLLSLTLWVWWGRRGVQREPVAGPPRIRLFVAGPPRHDPMPGPPPRDVDAAGPSPGR